VKPSRPTKGREGSRRGSLGGRNRTIPFQSHDSMVGCSCRWVTGVQPAWQEARHVAPSGLAQAAAGGAISPCLRLPH
jgi:hypothetical protein